MTNQACKKSLIYNPTSMEVRLRISPDEVMKTNYEDSYTYRASIKMDQLLSSEDIKSYETFDGRLKRAWAKFQSGKSASKDATCLSIVLVKGYKEHRDKKSEKADKLVDLSNQGGNCVKEAGGAPLNGEPVSNKPEPTPPGLDPNFAYPGKGLLKLQISEDKMYAVIIGFSTKNFEDGSIDFDKNWLTYELQRHKIKYFNEALMKRVLENLRRKKDVNQLRVTEGDYGKCGEEPSLQIATAHAELAGETEVLDVDETHFMTCVKKGDLVAKLMFKKEPEFSFNIFGERGAAPDPEIGHGISLGEGVEEKGYGQFYATVAGLPVVEDRSVSVSSALVIEGNVDLSSGDIDFDGPVVIQGSVEKGATVRSSDTINISQVQGGRIYAKGDINVEGCIVTNKNEDEGLECGGSVTADFIENTKMFVEKDVNVNKSLINCEMTVGGNINIVENTEGGIIGGQINCEQTIEAFHVGNKNATVTEIRIGSDTKKEWKLSLQKNRLTKMTVLLDQSKKNWQELNGRRSAQMGSKMKKMKEGVKKRYFQCKRIVESLEKRIASIQSSVSTNPKSKLIVKGTMYHNSVIVYGKKDLKVADDISNVRVIINPRGEPEMTTLKAEKKAS